MIINIIKNFRSIKLKNKNKPKLKWKRVHLTQQKHIKMEKIILRKKLDKIK